MKTVFFDVDTQIDFVYPAGALYVPGAEHILPVVAELNRRSPLVISTMDAHSEDDAEFQIYPHHCVVGTTGQHKPAITVIEPRSTLPSAPEGVRQLILEKQQLDCFTSPHLAPLLARLNADRYLGRIPQPGSPAIRWLPWTSRDSSNVVLAGLDLNPDHG